MQACRARRGLSPRPMAPYLLRVPGIQTCAVEAHFLWACRKSSSRFSALSESLACYGAGSA